MDFALFMERYGYKILLVVLLGGVFVFIFGMLANFMHSAGYSWGEVEFFFGLLFFAAFVAAFFGRFMNTATTLFGRISYHSKAKLFEDEKKIEKEREKLKEESGELY